MKQLQVRTTERFAPRRGSAPGLLGPICVNKDRKYDAAGALVEDKSFYLNQADYAGALAKDDWSMDLPHTKLIGGIITYDELNVTPELLAAGGGQYIGMSNGRPVTWKTAGIKPINISIEFPALSISQTDMNNAVMKANGITARIQRNRELELTEVTREKATRLTSPEKPVEDIKIEPKTETAAPIVHESLGDSVEKDLEPIGEKEITV